MDSRRQLKVSNLLKEVFAGLLNTKLKEYSLGSFVTLTNVRVTSDLALARFNISIYGVENKLDILNNFIVHTNEIKKIIGNEMRFDLRKIPEIEFYIDDSLDYVDKINEIFDKINDKKQ